MPVRLPSFPNPKIGESYAYSTKRGRPILFQVTDPANQPLYPYLLAMHVNPADLSEQFSKSKTVVMTDGGFVEFNWPDELETISSTGTTGAFLGPGTGLTSGSDNTASDIAAPSLAAGDQGRHSTMAWERQEDLIDLFRSNGILYDGNGRPVLRGRVMMIYDRGIYSGHFTTFSVKETDEKAYSFDLDWSFKAESVVYLFPGANNQLIRPGRNPGTTKSPEQLDAEFLATPPPQEQNGEAIAPPAFIPRRPDESDSSFATRKALFEANFGPTGTT